LVHMAPSITDRIQIEKSKVVKKWLNEEPFLCLRES